MNEQEWLASDDPAAMLRFATHQDHNNRWHHPKPSDRKLMLFACACRRRVPRLPWDGQSAGWQEMENYPERPVLANDVWPYGIPAMEHAMLFIDSQEDPSQKEMANLLREIVGNPYRPLICEPESECPNWYCKAPMRFYDTPEYSAGQWECTKCTRLDRAEAWFTKAWREGRVLRRDWLTPSVIAIAQACYDERPERKCVVCGGTGEKRLEDDHGWYVEGCKACGGSGQIWGDGGGIRPPFQGNGKKGTGRIQDGSLDPDRLLILGDTLEEAGCTDEAILNHCHQPGTHVRGCHVLDLILSKE